MSVSICICSCVCLHAVNFCDHFSLTKVNFLFLSQLNGDNTWEKDMVNVLKTFLELLKDDKTVSSYELHTSGVVRALLHCLSQVRTMKYLLFKKQKTFPVFPWSFRYVSGNLGELGRLSPK